MAGPGGPLAAIADTAAGTVSIVDLTSQTVVNTIDAGPGPQGLAMFPVQAPKAGLSTVSSSGAVPFAATFDGTKSTDRDGAIVSYTFTFGDGTSVTSPVPIVTHTYTTVGKFIASLVVTDDDGAPSAAVLTSVEVEPNKSPKAALKASETTGKAPFLVTFDASRSKDSDGTIASYTFTFGDGSSVTTSNPVVSHTYVLAGKYTAGVVTTDNAGGASSPATAGVEAIANKPPTAAFRARPSAGTAPLPVTFTDQSKDSDDQASCAGSDGAPARLNRITVRASSPDLRRTECGAPRSNMGRIDKPGRSVVSSSPGDARERILHGALDRHRHATIESRSDRRPRRCIDYRVDSTFNRDLPRTASLIAGKWRFERRFTAQRRLDAEARTLLWKLSELTHDR